MPEFMRFRAFAHTCHSRRSGNTIIIIIKMTIIIVIIMSSYFIILLKVKLYNCVLFRVTFWN
jgi:hypothetical protein